MMIFVRHEFKFLLFFPWLSLQFFVLVLCLTRTSFGLWSFESMRIAFFRCGTYWEWTGCVFLINHYHCLTLISLLNLKKVILIFSLGCNALSWQILWTGRLFNFMRNCGSHIVSYLKGAASSTIILWIF